MDGWMTDAQHLRHKRSAYSAKLLTNVLRVDNLFVELGQNSALKPDAHLTRALKTFPASKIYFPNKDRR
jgi:hypothetical protein